MAVDVRPDVTQQRMSLLLSDAEQASEFGYISDESYDPHAFDNAFLKQQKKPKNKRRSARAKLIRQNSTGKIHGDGRKSHGDGMESDTGSDGMAVNSGGSGRSGDWGPPQKHFRQRARRRSASSEVNRETDRHTDRHSWFDSGIAPSISSKTCSMTDVSHGKETHYRSRDGIAQTPAYRDIVYTRPEHQRTKSSEKVYFGLQSLSNVIDSQQNCMSTTANRDNSMSRSISCSALPSAHKRIDHREPPSNMGISSSYYIVPTSNTDSSSEPSTGTISSNNSSCASRGRRQPKHVTNHDVGYFSRQCSAPEIRRAARGSRSNSVTSDGKASSKGDTKSNNGDMFPLPEHLDYPLNKYRPNFESSTDKNTSAMKKMKDKFKRFKSKKQSADLAISNVLDIAKENDDDDINGEDILSRLSSQPSKNKSVFKRLFRRSSGHSYSVENLEARNKNSRGKSTNHGSSVDVSKDFHAEFNVRNKGTLSKAASLPTLHKEQTNEDYYEFPNQHNLMPKSELAANDHPLERKESVTSLSSAFAYVSVRKDAKFGSAQNVNGRTSDYGDSSFDKLDKFLATMEKLKVKDNVVPEIKVTMDTIVRESVQAMDQKASRNARDSIDSPRSDGETTGFVDWQNHTEGNREPGMKRHIRSSSCHDLDRAGQRQDRYHFSHQQVAPPHPSFYGHPMNHHCCCPCSHEPSYVYPQYYGPAYGQGPAYGHAPGYGHPQGYGHGPMPYHVNPYPIDPRNAPYYYHGPVVKNNYGPYPEEQMAYHAYQQSYYGAGNGSRRSSQSPYVEPDVVLAPLDVKVSSERRAERRKISDMVFDTFV